MWRIIKPVLSLVLTDLQYQGFRRLILVYLAHLGYSNSLRRMDKKIIELFSNKRDGIFIEVGAADGVDQSNTILLEKKYNWTGLLVEPIREQFEYCKKIRTNSVVENYCLTSSVEGATTRHMSRSNLTSSVLSENDIDRSHPNESVEISTLNNLLKKFHIKHVDILSLDVEGYEIEVLEGYDDNEGNIKYLIVETWDFEKFLSYAHKRNWQYIEHWGASDYLFRLS
jgi:FkbM family methyltransferase